MVTVKVHEAAWPAESVALQPTFERPTGNNEPDTGSHVEPTGGVPPWTIGAGKGTFTEWPSNEVNVMSAGQLLASGPVDGGGLGDEGDEQAAVAASARKSAEWARTAIGA
jgi:hypothetical protein